MDSLGLTTGSSGPAPPSSFPESTETQDLTPRHSLSQEVIVDMCL